MADEYWEVNQLLSDPRTSRVEVRGDDAFSYYWGMMLDLAHGEEPEKEMFPENRYEEEDRENIMSRWMQGVPIDVYTPHETKILRFKHGDEGITYTLLNEKDD